MDSKFETIRISALKAGTNLNLMSYDSDTLRNVIDLIREKQEEYIRNEIQEELGLKVEPTTLTIENIKSMLNQFCNDNSVFSEEIGDLYYKPKEQNEITKDNIPSLKKRIKYCKNPMEKKKLQQKLNALYKVQKRRK